MAQLIRPMYGTTQNLIELATLHQEMIKVIMTQLATVEMEPFQQVSMKEQIKQIYAGN